MQRNATVADLKRHLEQFADELPLCEYDEYFGDCVQMVEPDGLRIRLLKVAELQFEFDGKSRLYPAEDAGSGALMPHVVVREFDAVWVT